MEQILPNSSNGEDTLDFQAKVVLLEAFLKEHRLTLFAVAELKARDDGTFSIVAHPKVKEY